MLRLKAPSAFLGSVGLGLGLKLKPRAGSGSCKLLDTCGLLAGCTGCACMRTGLRVGCSIGIRGKLGCAGKCSRWTGLWAPSLRRCCPCGRGLKASAKLGGSTGRLAVKGLRRGELAAEPWGAGAPGAMDGLCAAAGIEGGGRDGVAGGCSACCGPGSAQLQASAEAGFDW